MSHSYNSYNFLRVVGGTRGPLDKLLFSHSYGSSGLI